ncbi:hypothetical protein HP397_01695 [Streptobacillus felis]|uniref:Uncharacterized protein n=1 Tax=Streptobacillus felis TaxID=1384509 RepID=A0A7Z0PEY9_9FUSO|nr:hypothetical protein [Streptobacillus felis]NYV27541.1 hypothetical protein [Streptobacillus felis]
MKEIFFKIFPKDWAKNVVEFRGFVNNPGMGGYITTLEGNNDLQYFAINVDEGMFRTIKGKIYFLTHEFAHSFSLNSNQFDYSCKLEKVNCFYDDSYLKEYYNLFWKDGFPENWQDNEMKKPKVFEKFYNANRDIFVSSYAANNMYEDFAETFAFFVLNKFPEGNDVKSYKIKYFYSKPELLELKKTILENMI